MNKNKIKNSRVVGIDLGTTNSSISYYDDTGKAKVIPNLEGDQKTPSVVYVGPRGKEILEGEPARNMKMLEPERTLMEVKRDVGTDKVYFTEGKIVVTPEWAQAQILKKLRESAIAFFSDDRAASEAVITVPAYFDEKQRQSVRRSADIAGIKVIELISEPTSAGLAHGVNEKQGDRMVIVMDFGGGTFDSSIIMYSGGEATVLATNGDTRLGGKDVDDLLTDLVLKAFKEEHGLTITAEENPADLFTIREEVIRQKIMLAARTEVKIVARVDGKQVVVVVTRKILDHLIKGLMERIEKITRETIERAKVDKSEIKYVLPIGGSSRLPPFQDLIKRMFGEESIIGGQVSADLAVCEGAVIKAVKQVGETGMAVVDETTLEAIPMPILKSSDVMAHSLGVMVQDPVSLASYCSVILERNSPIPSKLSKMYGSLDDKQSNFYIVIVQGENNQTLGDVLVVAEDEFKFPPRDSSEKTIEVTISYDSSGMVEVIIHDKISGSVENITRDFFVAA